MFLVTFRKRASLPVKAIVVAAAVGLLAACSEEKQAEAPEVVRPVKVVEVAAADEGRKLEYSGSVKARTEMNLGFRVAGKITERLVDVGDHVGRGDVLARMDAVDYQLAVRRAEADLTSAQKQVEITELAFRRAESLNAKNIASRSDLEQAMLGRDQAVALRQSAVSALEQARNQVAYAELKSDQDGIVTAVSADIGQVVSIGTPVVSVAVDGGREVEIAVPEMDVAEFKTGQMVKARFWSAADLVLDGKVREIAGAADPRSRTFMVRISLPDDPRVLLGMTATVEAREDSSVPAFSVPLAALGEKDGGPIVWIVDRADETVSARPVTVAGFTDRGASISEGLAEGDIVVSAGTQFMQEDLKVKLPEAVASRFGGLSTLSTASVTP